MRKIATFLFSLAFSSAGAQVPAFQMTVSGNEISGACVGTTIKFTNTSAVAAENLKWDFGNNVSVTGQNTYPYAYPAAGTFTVRLFNTVTNEVSAKTIVIHKNPTAAFNLSTTSTCVGNQVVFTSTGTGDNPIQYYYWSFGDGSAVSQESKVSHPYNKAGAYNASLYVEDQYGCKSASSGTQRISITGSSNVSFLANGNDFYSCDNTIVFTNTTTETGTTTYEWDFGDGSTSQSKNPDSHTYNAPGVYMVKLTAIIAGNTDCTPSYSRNVYVGKPNIRISSISTACANTRFNIAAEVNPAAFKASNKDIRWNLSGSGSFNSDSTSLAFSSAGTYQLTATNVNGCPNPVSTTITVKSVPSLTLSTSPSFGLCTTTDASLMATAGEGDTIDKYIWNTGDGTTDSTTSSAYPHTYTKAGTYTASVQVRTTDGCVSSRSISVPVSENCIDNGLGSAYNEDFLFSSASCADKYTITFTPKDSTKSVSGWTIDGVYHPATDNELTITLAPKENKLYEVVTNFANGTQGTTKTITIVDEKAKFSIQNKDNTSLNCAQNSYVFTADTSVTISNLARLQWNIQDAVTGQTVASATVTNAITYTYTLPSASTYKVSLTLVDKRTPGCTDNASLTLTTQGPVVDFHIQSDSVFCIKNPEVAIANTTVAYKNTPITKWEWDLGDGYKPIYTNRPDTVMHQYNYTGTAVSYNYAIQLRATDADGCVATLRKASNIKLYNPVVSFATADTLLCSSTKILISNISNAATPATYTWTVGDTSKVYLNKSDLNLNVKINSYPTTYDVRLHVVDGGGCQKDTLVKNYIKFLKPTAAFHISNADRLLTCPPYTLNFQSDAQNIDSLSWSLGDGSETSDPTPMYSVFHPGTFSIKLKSIGYDGCVDSIEQQYTAKGPVGNFLLKDSIGCTPYSSLMEVESNSAIVSYQWDYGDGQSFTSGNAKSVTHVYTMAGDYDPSVTIVGEEGCSDNLTLDNPLIVKDLSPSFKIMNGGSLCNQDTAVFYNTTALDNFPIRKFVWNWGDGLQSETDISDTVKHAFPALLQTYGVSLTAVTDFCTATSDTMAVSYHLIPAIGTLQVTENICLNDTLHAAITINDREMSNYTYQWELDKRLIGQDSLLLYPVTSSASTLYFKVTSAAGCSKDTSIQVMTRSLPTVTLETTNAVICAGDSTQLTASGAQRYTWSPTASLALTTENVTWAAPQLNTVYHVTGEGENGCFNSDSLLIVVNDRLNLQYQALYKYCTSDTNGILLSVSSENAAGYRWTAVPQDNSLLDGATGTTVRVRPSMTTTYSVESISKNVCPNETGDILVIAYDKPVITFPSPVITKYAGEVFTINPTVLNESDGLKYHWTPETRLSNPYARTPSVISDKDMTYTLNITSDYGCAATDSVRIRVLCDGSKLLMANAFTPNGDGINDRFYVTGYGIKNVDHFMIVDRWGKKVFERNNIASNDFSQGWDGTVNGKPAAPGTYMYLLQLTCTEDQKSTLRGSVVLIR